MNDTRSQRRKHLLGFLAEIQKAGMPVERLADDEPLVASGLIDSLAIMEIVVYLEKTYGMDFSNRGIDPEELGSIGSILDLIERESAGIAPPKAHPRGR